VKKSANALRTKSQDNKHCATLKRLESKHTQTEDAEEVAVEVEVVLCVVWRGAQLQLVHCLQA